MDTMYLDMISTEINLGMMHYSAIASIENNEDNLIRFRYKLSNFDRFLKFRDINSLESFITVWRNAINDAYDTMKHGTAEEALQSHTLTNDEGEFPFSIKVSVLGYSVFTYRPHTDDVWCIVFSNFLELGQFILSVESAIESADPSFR
jgi:hypothetical protein